MGYPHPDILLRQLSSNQIAEWMAYSQLEPFGEKEAFWRAGMIASVIANAHKSKKTRPFKPEDFMPKFRTKVERQSTDEIKEVMMSLVGKGNKDG